MEKFQQCVRETKRELFDEIEGSNGNAQELKLYLDNAKEDFDVLWFRASQM